MLLLAGNGISRSVNKNNADRHGWWAPYVLHLHQSISPESLSAVLCSCLFSSPTKWWEVNSPIVKIIMFKRLDGKLARGIPHWEWLDDITDRWTGVVWNYTTAVSNLHYFAADCVACVGHQRAIADTLIDGWLTVAYTAQTVNALYNVLVSEMFSAYCCWCSTINCMTSYSQSVGTEGE